MKDGLAHGFASPVLAAQAHFRALLDAMANPGRIVALTGELPAPPEPMAAAAFALALALVDHETSVWLGAGLWTHAVESALRFHCGCPITGDGGSAAFAFAASPADLGAIEDFAVGTPDYPDRSTTLIVEVEALAAHGAGSIGLSGPGIPDQRHLCVAGPSPGFWKQVRANNRRFPLGTDLVLLAGDRIAAVPRSTVVEAD